MGPDRPIWRSRLGLRVRIVLGALFLMALALIIGGIVVVGLLHRALVQDLQDGLVVRARDVGATAQAGGLVDPLPSLGEETGFVQVIAADGHAVAASENLGAGARLAVLPAPAPGQLASRTVNDLRLEADHDTDRYLVVAYTVQTADGPLTVYTASSYSHLDTTVRRLELVLFGGLPLLLIAIGVVSWWVVGRSLRPVDDIRAEVETITAEQLDRRLPEPVHNDEIGRLVRTMNDMLARLQDAAQQQRRFTADASHELRSPLAAARTELEVGLAHPEHADWPATADDVLVELDRLERLARDLLELTRLDPVRGLPHRTAVDLRALVDTEVQLRLKAGRQRYVARVKGPAVVYGDDALLTRLLRNLCDNAERHARSQVRVTLESQDHGVRLRVGNDGPPIAPGDWERIFQPFTRLDDARSADDGGSGLGLAIVRDIARAHGGRAAVDPDDGACFVVDLPSTGVAATHPLGRISESAPAAPSVRRDVDVSP
jgi:signal transduction histidine kinase